MAIAAPASSRLVASMEACGGHVYAILDAAIIDGLVDRLYASPSASFDTLWAGQPAADVFEVSPFIVAWQDDADLRDWIFSLPGRTSCMFVCSDADLEATQRQLRQFSMAQGPDGDPLICRFWDPVVLPSLLAVLQPGQRIEMYRGIQAFFACVPESSHAVRLALSSDADVLASEIVL